jgi:hypothetical protein
MFLSSTGSRGNEIPADLFGPLFGAAYNIASFKSGADALVDAGALEELSRLFQPHAAARRAAPLVLSQILAKRSEDTDPSRSAEKFCPQLLSLIRCVSPVHVKFSNLSTSLSGISTRVLLRLAFWRSSK